MFHLTDPTKPQLMWWENPHETHGRPGCYHSFLVPEGSEFGIATQEPQRSIVIIRRSRELYDLRNVHKPLPVSTYMAHDIEPYTMRSVDPKCRARVHATVRTISGWI